jgi:peptidylprolyl isomerase
MNTRDVAIAAGVIILIAAVAYEVAHNNAQKSADDAAAAAKMTIAEDPRLKEMEASAAAASGTVAASAATASANNMATKAAPLVVVAQSVGQHVKTTDGLEIDIEAMGAGDSAVAGAIVSVNYTGTFANGTVFDASANHGGPADFPIGVGHVIKGWDEGVVGMKIGEKRKLTIPPAIAYGASGKGPIPPNSTLTFEVELVGVKAPAPVIIAQNVGQQVTTADGLKIEILAMGKGGQATAGNAVVVNYKGTLADGTVFDASANHGGPATFPIGVGYVIKGWDEGVVGMKIGEKRKLTVPPEIGYGAKGTPGGPIPPNATLTFEVELVDVK